jgi:hypothetical protein
MKTSSVASSGCTTEIKPLHRASGAADLCLAVSLSKPITGVT